MSMCAIFTSLSLSGKVAEQPSGPNRISSYFIAFAESKQWRSRECGRDLHPRSLAAILLLTENASRLHAQPASMKVQDVQVVQPLPFDIAQGPEVLAGRSVQTIGTI
jgi:hypothetical protein